MTPEVRGLFQGDDGRRPPSPPRPVHRHSHGSRIERDPLVIDCDRCAMRNIACDDCVVTVLLGGPPQAEPLDETERHAIDVLADAGLVPPLRMSARSVDARESRDANSAESA